MATKLEKAIQKLEKHEAVWIKYGHPSDQYSANVVAEKHALPDGKPLYAITFHKYDLPAFDSTSYSSIEELAKAVLSLQSDLRRWRALGTW
jgi:hypothetical protein